VPELLEVERYRRLARRALHRPVVAVGAPDAWFLKGGLTAAALERAVVGRPLLAARRLGKLLLLDVDGGPTMGLRFGMTGVLEVDGETGVDRLIHSSDRREPAWDRLVLHFADGGDLRVRDPRRLGAVELDPDESRLGVDATELRPRDLRAVLAGTPVPLKARLLDQRRVAGIGNLLADEVLWRAGLDPARPAGAVTETEQRRLLRHLRATLAELGARGGSHTGDLQAARVRGGTCPRDGAVLLRRTIGGRTTFSCPQHQR
jgi:formamidopyrimidine-DNA glycosylase